MFFSPSPEILNMSIPSKISHFCIRPEKFEQLHDVTDVSSVRQEKKKEKTFLSRVKKNIGSSSSMKNTADDYTVQQLSAALVHSLH